MHHYIKLIKKNIMVQSLDEKKLFYKRYTAVIQNG